MRTRAVAYLRVSTDKQADRGVSLEAQRAKVQAYAALYDLRLVEVIVDAGVSAKTLERPGLTKALVMLRTGKADALLVVKLDRLTRSVRDLGTLVSEYFANGRSALLSVGEQIDTRSAAGRLVLNVLGSVSQWEREAIGERTSAALRQKAAQGEFTGGEAPFGFMVTEEGKLSSVETEQSVIREARALREDGHSLRAICRVLTVRGRMSRVGRPFAPMQIARMLTGNGETRAA
jgi:site-specific DNA recombinase